MYNLESSMYYQLCKLRDEYDLQGIKAEFEAEGSSFRDLMRLRRITSKAGVKLYLKIGGVEAVRDIIDSIELGVDGLIAPMVESKFGAKKFLDSFYKYYGGHKIHTTLNIETRNAIEEIEDILMYSKGKFDNITIGRSDLTASYFDAEIKPDSDFTFDLLDQVSTSTLNAGLTFTVGGSVSSRTVDKLNNKYKYLADKISKLETRKVILPVNSFLEKKDAITEALKFEELYILSKKEFSDLQIGSDIARLTELKRRT
jgi:hypothetical protein